MPFKVKVLNYHGNIKDLVEKCSKKIVRVELPMLSGYSFFPDRGTYHVQVCQGEGIAKEEDFNAYVCIVGPEKKRIAELMDEISTKFKLEFRDAPKHLEEMVQLFELMRRP